MAPRSNLKMFRKDALELIKIVENEEAVYNPQKRGLLSKTYLAEFWMETDINLMKCPGESLKEWTLLRANFCKEHRRVNMGFGTKWKYYDAMKFIAPYLKRNNFSPEQVQDEIVRNALNELDGVTRSTLKKSIEDTPVQNEDCFHEAEEDIENTSTIKDEISESNNEVSLEAWVDGSFDDNSNFQTQNTIEEIDESPNGTKLPSDDFEQHSETIEYVESPEKHHQNLEQEPTANCSEFKPFMEGAEFHTNPSSPSASLQLCSCKTNPDAMFLLSLLPDVQSLSKKDKGQFKLTVQKLLQDMLYPNDDC